MKKSFVMYNEWQPLFTNITDEQAGQLIKAVYAYQFGEESPPEEPLLNSVYQMMRGRFETDAAKYKEVCEKRKLNGQKGGLAKASKSYQKVANASEEKPKEPPKPKKEAPKKNEYGEYHNVRLTEQEHAKLSEKFGEGKTAEAIKILDTYIESLAPAKKKEYLKKNHNLCMQNWVYGEVDKRKGQTKPQAPKNSFNNFQQRGYDFGELERQLVENY